MENGKITTVHDMLINSRKRYFSRVAFKILKGDTIAEINYDRFITDVINVSSFFNDFRNEKFGIYANISCEWIVIFYAIEPNHAPCA